MHCKVCGRKPDDPIKAVMCLCELKSYAADYFIPDTPEPTGITIKCPNCSEVPF